MLWPGRCALLAAMVLSATPTWLVPPAPFGSQTPAATAGQVRLRAVGVAPDRARSAAIVVEEGVLVHTAILYPTTSTGQVDGGDAITQARQVIAGLDTALRAAGTSLGHVVRLHVYLRNGADAASVERLIAERFASQAPPAVTVVQSRLPLDGMLVAMDAVAAAPATTDRRPGRMVIGGLPPRPGGGAHVGTQPAGPFVIVSGRAAPGEFETAVRGTMEQLRGDLKAVGLGMEHVVHVKSFLGDMARADQLQRLVAGTFEGPAPPQVVTEWHEGSLPVEIELVATAPGAAHASERLTLVEPIAGRYSRIARVFDGRPVFVSGTTSEASDPVVQVREIFGTLERVLGEAGSDMRHIAKATYYVSDKAADQEINVIRPTIYDSMRPPAASKISVRGTGRAGRGATIDVIAVTTGR